MEKLLKIKYPLLFLAFLFIGFSNSCTEDPNSVGNSLIPDEDRLSYEKIDSYTAQFDQSFSSFKVDSLTFGSSSRLLLGKFKNVTSEILIRFLISLPDSIREGLDSNTISVRSAWIDMQPNYWIGDSNALRFNIQQINESWNSIEVNEDTINNVRTSLGPNIQIENSFATTDTSIVINIEPEVVKNWALRAYDDTYPENNGIFITPTTENSLAGFQALTGFPSDSYITLYTEFEKDGKSIDTVAALPNVDLHWITGERLPEPPRRILLQSSMGVRGKLWFDVSQVPSNILLNSAELKLFIDPTETYQGSRPADTIAVQFLDSFEDVTINYQYGKSPLLLDKVAEDNYSGDIRQFLQRWINGEDNNGLEIKLSDESRSVSTVSLYGSDSEVDSLKPRLTIYYSKK